MHCRTCAILQDIQLSTLQDLTFLAVLISIWTYTCTRRAILLLGEKALFVQFKDDLHLVTFHSKYMVTKNIYKKSDYAKTLSTDIHFLSTCKQKQKAASGSILSTDCTVGKVSARHCNKVMCQRCLPQCEHTLLKHQSF